MISANDIKNMSNMACLALSATDLAEYTTSIDKILTQAQMLNQLDTTNVEPTFTPLTGGTPLRPDVVKPFAQRDALLAGAPEISGTSYVVPRIL